MKRRLLLALIAVAAGLVGLAGIQVYVRHATDAAVHRMSPVQALTANRVIPAGTPAGQAERAGWLVPVTYPAASVPGSVRALSRADRFLVTSSALQPGQVLYRGALVPQARADSGLAVPHGLQVVTLQFCLAEAVAGFIRTGSHVAVYSTTGTGSQGGECGTRSHETRPSTHLLIRSVLVLATAPARRIEPASRTAAEPAGASTVMLVTVAVTSTQARALIALTEDGQPYLALLASGSGIRADAQVRG